MSKNKQDKAKVHKDIDGLELKIDEFGRITMNKSNEELNEFLNKNTVDKKLNKDQIKKNGKFSND